MGGGHLGYTLGRRERGDVNVAAVCDVEENRLRDAAKQAGPGAAAYRDYRYLLERKDIEAVIIATPDHWHHRMFVDSIGAGKHVYQQKPMCHSIEQGLDMVRVAKAAPKCVVQIGTQRRSGKQYAKAKEFIDSGKLGKVTFIRCWDTRNWVRHDPFEPYPFEGKLDWDRFELPCKQKSKYDAYRYFAWRWYWPYAGGLVNDVGVHVMDVVLWITGSDTPKPMLVVPCCRLAMGLARLPSAACMRAKSWRATGVAMLMNRNSRHSGSSGRGCGISVSRRGPPTSSRASDPPAS
jgi:predicted dehydrogenase